MGQHPRPSPAHDEFRRARRAPARAAGEMDVGHARRARVRASQIRSGAQSEAASHRGRCRQGADVPSYRGRGDRRAAGRVIPGISDAAIPATSRRDVFSGSWGIRALRGTSPRTSSGRMTATILITGFGPFPGAPFNPSEPLALELSRRRHPAFAGVRRVAHVFRVTYEAVDTELPALIAREKPAALVMFGLAARTKHMR